MKSTVSKHICKKEIPFPKLMISKQNKTIVLFTGDRDGTCVMVGNSINKLGEHSQDWAMGLFEDFTGSVCLEND